MIPISLLPSEYDTANTFMLNDINRLFVKYHRANGIGIHPRVLLVGRHEYDQITATSHNGPSARTFNEQWVVGRLVLGTIIDTEVRVVDAEHHAELI